MSQPLRPALTLADFNNMGVEVLSRVGVGKAKALASVGIYTVLDLLTYYPRRYVDRTNQAAICDLEDGVEAMVIATVSSVFAKKLSNNRSLVAVGVDDGTGHLKLAFFNQPWRERQLCANQEVVIFGKLDRYRGQKQMTNPIVDLIGDETGRIVPVYQQSEKAGIYTREIRRWVDEALRRSQQRGISDPLPEPVRAHYDLCGTSSGAFGYPPPRQLRCSL